MNINNPNVEMVVKSNTSFAISLYQRLKNNVGNIFFSPYSISTALVMAFAGSRGNTEKQIAATLNFSLNQKQLHEAFFDLETQISAIQDRGSVQWAVANALWPDEKYPFLAEYLTLLEDYYGVLITYVNYRETEFAREIINTWVEKKTNEMIKELIGPGVIDELTRLVLTNAIYFKGDWANQFDSKQTHDAPFWVTPEETTFVPMMSQRQDFGYSETYYMQILEIPYKGDEISFIVLLPKKNDGLSRIEKMLSEKALRKWIDNLRKINIRVFLPKFTVQSMFWLNDALQSMGMLDAFDLEKADFSGMDGTAKLYISAVLHKAFVDVNEEGTEAAAATAVVTVAYVPPPPIEFRADHPFLFLIRDNHSGSILFLGKMVNPSLL